MQDNPRTISPHELRFGPRSIPFRLGEGLPDKPSSGAHGPVDVRAAEWWRKLLGLMCPAGESCRIKLKLRIPLTIIMERGRVRDSFDTTQGGHVARLQMRDLTPDSLVQKFQRQSVEDISFDAAKAAIIRHGAHARVIDVVTLSNILAGNSSMSNRDDIFCIQRYIHPARNRRLVTIYTRNDAYSKGDCTSCDTVCRPFGKRYRLASRSGGTQQELYPTINVDEHFDEAVDSCTKALCKEAVSRLVAHMEAAHSLYLSGVVAEFLCPEYSNNCDEVVLLAIHSTKWYKGTQAQIHPDFFGKIIDSHESLFHSTQQDIKRSRELLTKYLKEARQIGMPPFKFSKDAYQRTEYNSRACGEESGNLLHSAAGKYLYGNDGIKISITGEFECDDSIVPEAPGTKLGRRQHSVNSILAPSTHPRLRLMTKKGVVDRSISQHSILVQVAEELEVCKDALQNQFEVNVMYECALRDTVKWAAESRYDFEVALRQLMQDLQDELAKNVQTIDLSTELEQLKNEHRQSIQEKDKYKLAWERVIERENILEERLKKAENVLREKDAVIARLKGTLDDALESGRMSGREQLSGEPSVTEINDAHELGRPPGIQEHIRKNHWVFPIGNYIQDLIAEVEDEESEVKHIIDAVIERNADLLQIFHFYAILGANGRRNDKGEPVMSMTQFGKFCREIKLNEIGSELQDFQLRALGLHDIDQTYMRVTRGHKLQGMDALGFVEGLLRLGCKRYLSQKPNEGISHLQMSFQSILTECIKRGRYKRGRFKVVNMAISSLSGVGSRDTRSITSIPTNGTMVNSKAKSSQEK